MPPNRHTRRQRRRAPAEFSYTVATPIEAGHPFVLLTLCDISRQVEVAAPMRLGVAHELGHELLLNVQAVLAGAARPWDDDPDRVPFASRSRARMPGASPAARPLRHDDRGAAGPAIRPTRGVESAR